MKSRKLLTLAVTAILVLPLHSQAQSAADNCNAVGNAAARGRDQANSRIQSAEDALRTGAARQRDCMEQFGDIAARSAMVIGGFDLSPLRKLMTDKGCDIINGQVRAIQNQATGAINGATAPIRNVAGSAGVPASTVSTQTRSIWDRMSCSVSGNC
jgi:hypothetical protein